MVGEWSGWRQSGEFVLSTSAPVGYVLCALKLELSHCWCI